MQNRKPEFALHNGYPILCRKASLDLLKSKCSKALCKSQCFEMLNVFWIRALEIVQICKIFCINVDILDCYGTKLFMAFENVHFCSLKSPCQIRLARFK